MTQKTALLLLDLQNEMVDAKGKVGGGGLAKVVAERGVLRTPAMPWRQPARPMWTSCTCAWLSGPTTPMR